MARPNRANDLIMSLLDAAQTAGLRAAELREALVSDLKRRGVESGLLRLYRDGLVARAYEYELDGHGNPTVRVYRYYAMAYADPVGVQHLQIFNADLSDAEVV